MKRSQKSEVRSQNPLLNPNKQTLDLVKAASGRERRIVWEFNFISGPQIHDQRTITKGEWVDLSRKLLTRARSGFTPKERATVAGFINYVAPDVETIQRPEDPKC